LPQRGVAQLGSAPVLGTGGRWFESSHPDFLRSKTQRKRLDENQPAGLSRRQTERSEVNPVTPTFCEAKLKEKDWMRTSLLV
jgi:hypothetical protein